MDDAELKAEIVRTDDEKKMIQGRALAAAKEKKKEETTEHIREVVGRVEEGNAPPSLQTINSQVQATVVYGRQHLHAHFPLLAFSICFCVCRLEAFGRTWNSCRHVCVAWSTTSQASRVGGV